MSTYNTKTKTKTQKTVFKIENNLHVLVSMFECEFFTKTKLNHTSTTGNEN